VYRNQQVDALRGIAITLVLLGHSFRYVGTWSIGISDTVTPFIVTGAYYGVTIFFVISGYLITRKFVDKGQRALSIKPMMFYAQRAGRIFPPLALLLGVTGLLAIFLGAELKTDFIVKTFWPLLTFDFGAVSIYWPHTESALDPLWSLRDEEIFYVFMPILVILTGRRDRATFVLSVIFALGIIFRIDPTQRAYAFFATWDQIALGSIVAINKDRISPLLNGLQRGALKVTGLTLIIVIYFTTKMTDSTFCVSGVAVGAAIYLISLDESKTFGPILIRPLASFGRLSYEIYLSHLMVFWAMAALARLYPVLERQGPAAICFFLVTLVITYGLSLVISRFYSEPANRAIRRLVSPSVKTLEIRTESISNIETSGSPISYN
jgi:peptidoglycan/LPS O-acetylase OafA/YrhL